MKLKILVFLVIVLGLIILLGASAYVVFGNRAIGTAEQIEAGHVGAQMFRYWREDSTSIDPLLDGKLRNDFDQNLVVLTEDGGANYLVYRIRKREYIVIRPISDRQFKVYIVNELGGTDMLPEF